MVSLKSTFLPLIRVSPSPAMPRSRAAWPVTSSITTRLLAVVTVLFTISFSPVMVTVTFAPAASIVVFTSLSVRAWLRSISRVTA